MFTLVNYWRARVDPIVDICRGAIIGPNLKIFGPVIGTIFDQIYTK